MGFNIEDGTGKGYQAKVNEESMLVTYAIVNSMEHHANHKHGVSYNLLFSETASGAEDCIVYIKNLDDKDLLFEGITANVATDETLKIILNDIGTPVGGSISTSANLNGGANNIADGTFQTGSDITGLSGGITTFKYFFKGGESSKHYNFEQDIVLSKNRVLTIYCVNGSILVDGFISFFYHSLA